MNPRHHSKFGLAFGTRPEGRRLSRTRPGRLRDAQSRPKLGSFPPETGQHLLEEIGDARSVGPAVVTRLRKHAPPEAVAAAVRLAQARRKAAMKFEQGAAHVGRPHRRRASDRSSRSPGTRPAGSDAGWSSTSARASAAIRWPWRHGPTSWPSISIRRCAGESGLTPQCTAFPTGSSRSGLGPSDSRSPPVPGFIWTPTGGHRGSRRAIATRGLFARPHILEFAHRSSPRRCDQAQPGRRLLDAFRGARTSKSS